MRSHFAKPKESMDDAGGMELYSNPRNHSVKKLSRMAKYLSFSLYGRDAKYCIGAAKNAVLAKHWYPDYQLIFWASMDVPDEVLDYLAESGAIVKIITRVDMGGMFWRFLVNDLPDCERYLVRDTDSRINEREVLAVREWEKSGKSFHVIRDHPHHSTDILGCSWGATKDAIGPIMESLIDKWDGTKEGYDADQEFLRKIIWPRVKRKSLQHGSCLKHIYPEEVPLPSPLTYDNPRFVGEVFDHLDRPRAYDWEKMLMAVRQNQPVVGIQKSSHKPPLFIRPHLGLGDALIVNALVRTKAAEHTEVIFPSKKQNLVTIKEMFADIPNVKVIEVEDDSDADLVSLKWKDNTLRLGMFNPNWNGGKPGWDKLMYEQAGVPWGQRWDGFIAGTLAWRRVDIPVKHFALVHDDLSRNFTIPRERLPKMSIVWVGASRTIFDYVPFIWQAEEIHCIDSCIAILADTAPTEAKKLVLHLYARPNAKPPTFRKEWEILKK